MPLHLLELLFKPILCSLLNTAPQKSSWRVITLIMETISELNLKSVLRSILLSKRLSSSMLNKWVNLLLISIWRNVGIKIFGKFWQLLIHQLLSQSPHQKPFHTMALLWSPILELLWVKEDLWLSEVSPKSSRPSIMIRAKPLMPPN